MGFMRRIASGALGGAGGTLVLTGFREVLTAAGLVGVTAPEQVIARLEELGLLDDPSPETRRVLTAVAHLAYGVGIGAALGLLRGERGGLAEETAVGTALGILAWGATGPSAAFQPGSTGRRGRTNPKVLCRSSTTRLRCYLGGLYSYMRSDRV